MHTFYDRINEKRAVIDRAYSSDKGNFETLCAEPVHELGIGMIFIATWKVRSSQHVVKNHPDPSTL
jgi:hypothetical protein